MKIVNYYIEVPEGRQIELEILLRSNGFNFYDSTNSDPYTKKGNRFKCNSVIEIEADIEYK